MSETLKNQSQGQQKDEASKLAHMLDYQNAGQAEQQLEKLAEKEQSQEETDPAKLSRRKFLNRLSLAVGGACALAVVVPVAGFVVLPLFETPEQPWRDVGAVDDFKAGDTKEVEFLDASTRPWAGVASKTAAWLRREQDGSFMALSINCTHLGCPVEWLPKADLFFCPCHGGVYYKDGTVAAGPPPEPLANYPVRVQDGRVQIQASPIPITGPHAT
jgi:menaquinol-cytochrome c reductase iron-sulfur subunit